MLSAPIYYHLTPSLARAPRHCTALPQDGFVSLERRADLLQRAEPRICAWDIETTKLPLQFPNSEYDQVGPRAHACAEGSLALQALRG